MSISLVPREWVERDIWSILPISVLLLLLLWFIASRRSRDLDNVTVTSRGVAGTWISLPTSGEFWLYTPVTRVEVKDSIADSWLDVRECIWGPALVLIISSISIKLSSSRS
jgi:hypothetical protein